MIKKQSIKKLTVTRLLQVFIVSILIIVSVTLLNYRSFFQFVVENKVKSVSEIIKAGLTAHMQAGVMDKRAYFLNEIASVHDIESIEVVRGDNVIKQYGESSLPGKKLNGTLRAFLQKKEIYINWEDTKNSVEALVPYIASSSGDFNCLQCHNAEDGTVLGAVNIKMDISLYQSFVLRNSYIIVAILFLLALISIFNMFNVIDRYIYKPLLKIIDEGEAAYLLHKEINSEKYETKELQEVVRNVNKFNKTVLEKEDQLKDKNKQLSLLNEEIESTLKETMLTIGEIEEIRGGDTSMHTRRVAAISTVIAQDYGLDDEKVKLIEIASPLHDIGKIGIADAILNKPARLTLDEYTTMKSHSLLGYDILKNSKRQILKTAAIIAYEHHEKYDGTGYPRGLKGEEISIFARIVSIVDVLDALLSKRVYKKRWSVEEIINLLKKERGKQFDPELVDVVIKNIDKYVEIIKRLSD
ncbi:HD domain-containing phosphohydrolase [Sulfurimonas sp.]|uniref:HD-GYP domain-containing protein n=1 Tax=Sulfurimonas sp. TaxID=2022749 RepID=UPI002611AF60|nr:HD domain-containing phosphohydrolase [Sulfurimonas sp.]MCW8896202.1 HD domain-containing protein [Sulfurimonas sp.]MCW9067223.1 HD domain-containing protein [Sulfurimonas sp.]